MISRYIKYLFSLRMFFCSVVFILYMSAHAQWFVSCPQCLHMLSSNVVHSLHMLSSNVETLILNCCTKVGPKHSLAHSVE